MRSFSLTARLFILSLIFWGAAQGLPPDASGADAVVTRAISFGSIDLHPGGDIFTIAASGGSAVPVASFNSVVTGGHSGLITVTSQAVEHVDITYPASVTLTSSPYTIQMGSIDTHSQYSVVGTDTLGGGIPLLINVGGRINIPSGQAHGSYTAIVAIVLNFS